MPTFRYAIVLSAVIHSAIFLPVAWREKMPDVKKKDIAVEYIVIKEPPKPLPPRPAAETPKVEVAAKVELKPEAPVKPKDEAKKTETEADDAAKQARKEAALKYSKDYINYYQLLRERVRRRLKANYRDRSREGDVELVFVLTSQGSLLDAGADDARSSPDAYLRRIALASLKEAAPFPSFPEGLSVDRMSFTLTVSFKKSE